LQINL
jgi:hypothetical protein